MSKYVRPPAQASCLAVGGIVRMRIRRIQRCPRHPREASSVSFVSFVSFARYLADRCVRSVGARERSALAAAVRRARVARDIPYARLALTRLALRARAAVGALSHALRRHIGVGPDADHSPQVVAGVASFRLGPPLSRKMLLLASGWSRGARRIWCGARSGRAGSAVDARIGGKAMSSVGEASTGVLGSGSERGMNGARRITVFVQWRERQTTRKRWAEPHHPAG
jgi:hypothetical protein